MDNKIVILNLRECFGFGLNFRQLAEVEKLFLQCKNIGETINVDYGTYEFKSCNKNKADRLVCYYQFNPIF